MAIEYEIKRFKNSRDSDLAKAITIYSNGIEPLLRTDTNEIIYWLDEYSKLFDDRILLFGFYINEEIVGYAQLALFTSDKLVFVDYIVIDKEYRRNNTFFEFVNQIEDFMEKEGVFYNYIIAEVGGFTENLEPTKTTRNIIRLLKMLNFGVVKAPYFHPKLGKENLESELQSVLMIYTKNELKAIRQETYIQIIEVVYYKHYYRWYQPFMSNEEIKDYHSNLEVLLNKIKKNIKGKETIQVNGFPNSYATGTSQGSSLKIKNIAKNVAILILFIVFLIGFGILHSRLKDKYGIDTNAQTYIIISASIAVLFIVTLISEGRTKTLSKIVEKILNKLTG